MGNDKSKTKSAMLSELESIKGLLLEDDDIPILQEVIEPQVADLPDPLEPDITLASRIIVEQQQDFFVADDDELDTGEDLLDSLDDLEEKTGQLTQNKSADINKPSASRPNLTKASGENPFLPEHIRARLHGNNPPPSFAAATARKIAGSARPVTQLGNLQAREPANRSANMQQDIIDSIVARMMPEMEKELRQRLEALSKAMLDELNKY